MLSLGRELMPTIIYTMVRLARDCSNLFLFMM